MRPIDVLSIEVPQRGTKLKALRGFTPSSDHFDKIRYFLAGIEIYPLAGRVQIGQALIFFALNPDQVLVSRNLPADLVIFRVKLDSVFHWSGGTLARMPREVKPFRLGLPRPCQRQHHR
jgi:hypothetical protein